MQKQTVIIAFGGVSPEHEVSVLSAMQAFAALENSQYHTVPLYISKSGKWYTGDYLLRLEHYEDLAKIIRKSTPCTFAHDENSRPVLQELKRGLFSRNVSHPVYAVLVAFHGSEGENGSFQGICETFNIPFTGSGVLASSVGMDKKTSKTICRAHGIPVVNDVDFFEPEWEKSRDSLISEIGQFGYPVVVKPVHLGSSIGVTVARDKQALAEAVELAFRYDEHVLVEKAISPLIEVNCSVLGEAGNYRVSVCERPMALQEHLSFEDKYQSERGESKGMASAERIIPADISPELTQNIQKTTETFFRVLGGAGLARLDFLVNSETGDYYFNEINTIPGSFSFYLWEATGTSFGRLMLELIEIAVQRHKRKNGRVQSYQTNLLSQKAVKGLKGLKSAKTGRE